MNDSIYWISAGIVSLFIGFSFYKCLVNPTDEKKPFRFKVYQGWNQAICFFIGVGGVLYYFIKVRFQQLLKNGATLSLSDIVLILFFLSSGMELTPYLLTYITKVIPEVLKKRLEQ